jgi:formylglycine-generating enzyme required for sulfatase activity
MARKSGKKADENKKEEEKKEIAAVPEKSSREKTEKNTSPKKPGDDKRANGEKKSGSGKEGVEKKSRPSKEKKKKKKVVLETKEQRYANGYVDTAEFKDHPYFKAGHRHHGKVKSAPPSQENPFLNIIDQHSEHRFRIAKITAAIFAILTVVFIADMGFKNWKRTKTASRRVAAIGKRMEALDARIKSETGYDRDKTIAKAIALTRVGEMVDWKRATKWQKIRERYFATLKAKPKKPNSFVLPSTAMNMVFIPRGSFKMGKTPDEAKGCQDETPRRSVQLNYDFWIADTETTNAQYKVFYPQYRVPNWSGYTFNLPEQPVVRVSWHLAREYCEMLTFREKKRGRLPPGYVYRLPTEAEWERACRAGTDSPFFWGDEFGEKGAEFANCLDQASATVEGCDTGKNAPKNDGYYVTAPVASFRPNAFGLYDTSGNVWEWCYDWYNPKAYRELFHIDPVQTTPVTTTLTTRSDFEREVDIETTSKVIRGGGCLSPPVDCRSATRDFITPETRDFGIGFRVVLAPSDKIATPTTEENGESDQ